MQRRLHLIRFLLNQRRTLRTKLRFIGGNSGPIYDDDVIIIDAVSTGPKKLLKEFEAATDFTKQSKKEEKIGRAHV
jgi:hypothetical protein